MDKFFSQEARPKPTAEEILAASLGLSVEDLRELEGFQPVLLVSAPALALGEAA